MITGSAGFGWRRIAAIIAPAVLIAGCAGTPDTTATQSQETAPEVKPETAVATPQTLADTSWRVIDILGRPASAASSTLSFGADGVSGNSGCNDFRGNAEIEGDHVKVGALATTRKMCTPPVNGQETVFLETLSLTHSWRRTGDKLELLDESGALLISLEPL